MALYPKITNFVIQSTFMEKEKYIEDLRDIKEMMNRSSRFISLSGLSGIVAGIIALAGAYAAYETVYSGQNYLNGRWAEISWSTISHVLIIAIVTLGLAIGSGIFFTRIKAQKDNQKLWDDQAKRLLVNMIIPLVTGGLICLILLFKGFIGFAAPFTLVFYGLALVNASKYTLSEVRSLGIMEIALGVLGSHFIGYGLLLWAIGFGVLHIIYGVIMFKKYGA